jgi:hypothetical protein
MTNKNGISSVEDTVRRETLIAVVVNCVIAAALTWITVEPSRPSVLVGGPGAGAFGILPGTFLFTFLLSLGLSFALRARIRRGELCAEDRETALWVRLLPRNVLLRAFLLAAAATFLGPPATFSLLHWLAPGTAPFSVALTVNIVYFALLACLVVPVIVRTVAFNAALTTSAEE